MAGVTKCLPTKDCLCQQRLTPERNKATSVQIFWVQCPNAHDSVLQAAQHEDLVAGFGEVYVPEALAGNYRNASRETGWQWVFPAKERSHDHNFSKKEMRRHLTIGGKTKSVIKPVSARHSPYPTHPGNPSSRDGGKEERERKPS
jgi:hypothetical protein